MPPTTNLEFRSAARAFRGANLAHGHKDQLRLTGVALRLMISGSGLWQRAVEAALATAEDQYLFL